jgi:hypothetical protein
VNADLVPFTFEGHQVRTIIRDGEPPLWRSLSGLSFPSLKTKELPAWNSKQPLATIMHEHNITSVPRRILHADTLPIPFYAGVALLQWCFYWARKDDGTVVYHTLRELVGYSPGEFVWTGEFRSPSRLRTAPQNRFTTDLWS